MADVFMLDAGALLSTWTQRHPASLFITTPEIIAELHNRPSRMRAENLRTLGRLVEMEPDDQHVTRVKRMARESGDDAPLSTNDMGLLAVALAEHESGRRVAVVSTDLAVLNAARLLGLETVDLSGKMRHVIRWEFRCPACGHVERESPHNLECPVCGTGMIRKRRSQRRV